MVRGTGMSMQVLGRLGTVIVLFVAFGTSLIFGQGGTATILGVVHDTTGAVLPGVTITVKHIESGLSRIAISNERGDYNLQFLPVGPYELATDMPGFRQQVRRGINLAIG